MFARPLTGLVCAFDEPATKDDRSCTLEFFKIYPKDVINADGNFDFSQVERKLEKIHERKRQAVIRLCLLDGEKGYESMLPKCISDCIRFVDIVDSSKYKRKYPRWDAKDAKYVTFAHAFIENVGRRIDEDVRVAYVQGFVGHWSEGHVYRNGVRQEDIGVIFPNPKQYASILQTAKSTFKNVRWSVGISAGDRFYWRGRDPASIMSTAFSCAGTFEDTFLDTNKVTVRWNDALLRALDAKLDVPRWHISPRGGEISFSTGSQEAAIVDAPRDIRQIATRHMTYCVSMDMWKASKRKNPKIRSKISASFGYRFRVEIEDRRAEKPSWTILKVTNVGVSPIYYRTVVVVGALRYADFDLASLMPGTSKTLKVGAVGSVFLVCVRSAHPKGLIPFDAAS